MLSFSEQSDAFLLTDIEEDLLRFIDVFALIYPHLFASDEA